MATRPTTSLQWPQLARLDDAHLPLWEAALLIARDEYPDLNIESYRRRMARMGRRAMAAVANIDDVTESTRVLNDFVYGELGLTGNHDDYLDPRNARRPRLRAAAAGPPAAARGRENRSGGATTVAGKSQD